MREHFYEKKLLFEKFSAQAYHTVETLTQSIMQALSDLLNERTYWQEAAFGNPYAYGLCDTFFSLFYDRDSFADLCAAPLQRLIEHYEPRLSNVQASFDEDSNAAQQEGHLTVRITGDILLHHTYHPVSFPIVMKT
ncbi:MAG: GPW/gp25 family protein [Holosporales bacterium]|jgi:type VI secretion system lysozyme-like protein|nr:GPW/gp25 family protein [Holosporales bacterium]